MAVPDTRARLIAAAEQLLEEEGLDAVTLRGVGDVIGVSRTTPYRHFPDKDGLLAAVAVGGFDDLRSRIGGADPDARPRDRLAAMLGAYVDFAVERPALYRLLFGHGLTKKQPQVVEAATAAYRTLVQQIAVCQADGSLRAGPPERLAALLWSAGHGLADLTVAVGVGEDKGFVDPAVLFDLLLDGLSPGRL